MTETLMRRAHHFFTMVETHEQREMSCQVCFTA